MTDWTFAALQLDRGLQVEGVPEDGGVSELAQAGGLVDLLAVVAAPDLASSAKIRRRRASSDSPLLIWRLIRRRYSSLCR